MRDRDPATLVAPTAPPVRCTRGARARRGAHHAERAPHPRLRPEPRRARAHPRRPGRPAAPCTLRTAEVLQDGELYTRPLREARSTDHYTLAGRAGGEEWEPRFTFHGFRYVEVDGWPGDLDADVAAVARRRVYPHRPRAHRLVRVVRPAARTGCTRTSSGACAATSSTSRPTARSATSGVGWTGDIQVFAPTASFLYDVSGMLGGWLRDVAAEQLPDGTIPWYVPVIPAHEMWTPIRPGAAWGDVATFTPWTLYERFGDVGVLAAQFDSAPALGRPGRAARRARPAVERRASSSATGSTRPRRRRIRRRRAPTATSSRPPTSPGRRAWLARMAGVLGRADDEARYGALADEVDAAFAAEYVLPDGRMTSDAQTAYALAIAFDLIPDDARREAAGDRLAELVREADNRIATGFVGTPLVSDALTAQRATSTRPTTCSSSANARRGCTR